MTHDFKAIEALAKAAIEARDKRGERLAYVEIGQFHKAISPEFILSLTSQLAAKQSELDDANLKIAQQFNKLAEAREAALEDAAYLLTIEAEIYVQNPGAHTHLKELADRIRALKHTTDVG